jgi:hypothetical protein
MKPQAAVQPTTDATVLEETYRKTPIAIPLRVDIDGLEEARCAALVQSARYQEGIRRYHDRNAKERSFNVGDLILCCTQNTEGLHKISSPWEGPFTVAKVTGPGLYRLQTLKGEDISNSWNVDQLCRFYV